MRPSVRERWGKFLIFHPQKFHSDHKKTKRILFFNCSVFLDKMELLLRSKETCHQEERLRLQRDHEVAIQQVQVM